MNVYIHEFLATGLTGHIFLHQRSETLLPEVPGELRGHGGEQFGGPGLVGCGVGARKAGVQFWRRYHASTVASIREKGRSVEALFRMSFFCMYFLCYIKLYLDFPVRRDKVGSVGNCVMCCDSVVMLCSGGVRAQGNKRANA